jgi:rubrerythrin
MKVIMRNRLTKHQKKQIAKYVLRRMDPEQSGVKITHPVYSAYSAKCAWCGYGWKGINEVSCPNCHSSSVKYHYGDG